MACENEGLRKFAKEMFKINAIKFGEFKTKVGLMTPVYCDLRVIVSYPKLMDTLAELLLQNLKKYDVVCGVPYTALPIATILSAKTNIPMIMRRKEAKSYGTKKIIEGVYKEGDNCLIVEDVVTSGSSILETVKDLTGAGLKCSDAIVLLNREQGGEEFLKNNGIKMHALLSLTELMKYLKEEGCVDNETVQKVKDYLDITQIDVNKLSNTIMKDRLSLSFQARAKLASNTVAAQLFKKMASKQSTLCVAADLTNSTDILNLAEEVGPYICVFKTHIDVVEDFHINFIKALQEIADRHDFILFEDRKFADIGKTVQLQYSKGVYKISSWAQLVTAHSVLGKSVLDGIKTTYGLESRGVLLLAETSAACSLIGDQYIKDTLKMAEDYPDLVAGIVCQNPLFINSPGLIQFTPGVQIGCKSDNLGQQYNTPDIVIRNGADVAIVGRGIVKATNPAVAAKNYRDILWETYIKRVGES